MSTPTPLDIDALLDNRATRVVVCCGAGGVGKTTTAAALALRAAERGRSVVVLTIDPARRLAQSLGLPELTNNPAAGPDRGDPAAGGQLHAMMLDMRRTFDEMVQAHASPERAAQIIANPFYQAISSSFSGTQEYMAMEKLGQLVAARRVGPVVVDTPPSRSALDFLDAPQRLSSFLDGRMIRLLSAPARAGGRGVRRLVGAGFGLFTRAISTILGGQMLADASAFVQAFDTMFGGFRERAHRDLRAAPRPGHRVRGGRHSGGRRGARGVLLRRPAGHRVDAAGGAGAQPDTSGARRPSGCPRRDGGCRRWNERAEAADSAGPLAAAVLRLHADRVALAQRERRLLARFRRAHPAVAVVAVPALAVDVHDLPELRRIGRLLAGKQPAVNDPASAPLSDSSAN